jgi:hypothetical protein
LIENANANEPTVDDAERIDDGNRPSPRSIQFRWHFLLAFVTGICLTGHPIQWLTAPIDSWPLMALAMEFGPWAHPLNFVGSLFVMGAIPLIQIAKWLRPCRIRQLRIAQIGIWWIYWLMFGLAQQFGTWRGP